MSFLNKAFQKLQAEAEKALDINNSNNDTSRSNDDDGSSSSLSMASVMHYDSNATRWEKAVVATDSIVRQVTKFDPDGVDVVCVGGALPGIDEEESNDDDGVNDDDTGVEWYRNIQDTKGLEDKVTSKDPKGPCPLGQAMDEVLKEALQKDLKKTPCSVLVLTAGRPDDAELLEEALSGAAQHIADNGGVTLMSLSVTFIQIGNDDEASKYLRYLDKKMVGFCSNNNNNNNNDDDDDDDDNSNSNSNDNNSNRKVDIVDTMSYEEIKDTMDQMKEHNKEVKKSQSNGKNGAIFGAVAGAAIGVGGMYLHSKQKAKKRVTSGSWQGKWKCFYEDEEITTLSVKDDKQGNLQIDGFQDTLTGVYGNEDEDEDGNEEFFIRFTDPTGEVVEGTFHEKLFVLNWSDGTRWEALNKTNWAGYVGAATAGAAAIGATGYMVDKKFFNKINQEDNCDYIIVVDRSANMATTDTRNHGKSNKLQNK